MSRSVSRPTPITPPTMRAAAARAPAPRGQYK